MLHPKSLNLVIVVQMLVYQLKKDHCSVYVCSALQIYHFNFSCSFLFF